MIKIDVATGQSAESRTWKNQSWTWSDFVERLHEVHRTHESFAVFQSLTKREQGKVKDVGGYVCGYLNGGRRGKANVMHRSALTLDLDWAPYDLWDTLVLLWGCAMVLHSTHSHCRDKPRYRLIVPLDRVVTPDEYIAIARRFAASINIEYFDPTTFDTNRLMFWPSASKGAEYIFEEQDGPALCADEVLGQYRNWKDISEWAFSEKVSVQISAERAKKLADPTAKNNIVGYFCRAYDIHRAIEEFLPDVYEPVGDGTRYTYLHGSTAAGMVVYDDGLFAYSNHATDPVSEMGCNAFDLVRIHKFGGADNEKSFKQMSEFARALPSVRKEIAESIASGFEEFAGEKAPDATPEAETPEADPEPVQRPRRGRDSDDPEDWKSKLSADRNNKLDASARNIALILRNDPRLKDLFAFNLFSRTRHVMRQAPWNSPDREYPSRFANVDVSGLRDYFDQVYGITSPQKIGDAVALEAQRNAYHPVRDYFDSLEWDGVPRIDTLLSDCFGALDSVYAREVSRKWMVAAVARVFQPGCKFDTVITLVGEEGTRKSSFFRRLGLDWFTDSFSTLEGNKAVEQLKGKLIVEIPELSAFGKFESERIKQFITIGTDTTRLAYAEEVEDYPRQCVFAATTNDRTFLRGTDGNRRFWPIGVRLAPHTGGRLDPMSAEFGDLIPRFWAEAVWQYRRGESLILTPEAERLANGARREHAETDDRQGVIGEYLERRLPENWDKMALPARRIFLEGAEGGPRGRDEKTFRRTFVCAAEIWCECFSKEIKDFNTKAAREVSAAMKTLPGWEQTVRQRRVPLYGTQRGYERKE